jgi:Phosphate-starvation-inducible E family
MNEEKLRLRFGDYLGQAEVIIYSILAVLLFVTALATIADAGKLLWESLLHWAIASETLLVLDQLLVVLMLVEILHTVRISIRSHILVTEPFLVVGLIASIRRILVITLQASTLTKGERWSSDGASLFHAAMLELGLLGLIILVLIISITLLRRYAPAPKTAEDS